MSKPTLTLGQPNAARVVDPRLQVGDPAPWFVCASNVNPTFDFSTAAGRYLVLSFFGSTAHPVGKALIDSFLAVPEVFADPDFYCFGVSIDSNDRQQPLLTQIRPGIDIFWDTERKVAQRYQVVQGEASLQALQPVTFLLDPDLRILGIFATQDGRVQADSVLQVLKRLPKLGAPRPSQRKSVV